MQKYARVTLSGDEGGNKYRLRLRLARHILEFPSIINF
ncbi:hypothetical protein Ctha_0037 [Chloroherpeton thalassium ATCC 35110]|uniref:Uncharacterized protein n=1 Tax=Chloroherpeton thalassium (strain ATCC 35110 / GB-78) TaxID=517418 RepID=B3QSB8_CHLT3|nr:hypothetical protein Ctha_0037 [Chloroherpeton thalassium ATCC 35110]